MTRRGTRKDTICTNAQNRWELCHRSRNHGVSNIFWITIWPMQIVLRDKPQELGPMMNHCGKPC
jgi:hypothetical protein